MKKLFDEVLSKAKMAFASKEYETALIHCEKAIELQPDGVKAYALAGNICLVCDRLADAEQYFRQAVDLDSATGERYFALANSLFGQKRYAEALEYYAKAEQLGCSDKVREKIYYLMNVLNQYSGGTKDRSENYRNISTSDETSVNTSSGEGNLKETLWKHVQMYVEAGDFANAENCAVQLKLLEPRNFQNYHLLLQLLLEQQKTAQAERVFREGQKYCEIDAEEHIDEVFDEAWFLCYHAEQNPKQDKTYYEKAVQVLQELSTERNISSDIQCEITVTIAEISLKMGNIRQALSLAEQIANEQDEELMEFIERARAVLEEGAALLRE